MWLLIQRGTDKQNQEKPARGHFWFLGRKNEKRFKWFLQETFLSNILVFHARIGTVPSYHTAPNKNKSTQILAAGIQLTYKY